MPSTLEPVGLERTDGKRPDGLTSFPWKYGKHMAWDVTCVDTLAQTYLPRTTVEAGSAASEAERKKTEKYRFLEPNTLFSPAAFETFGPWGPGAKDLINEIGRRAFLRSGEPRTMNFLRQRISIEIQRGNAASVLGTFEYSRGLEEVFYILSFKQR